jgi:hypothetical protein
MAEEIKLDFNDDTREELAGLAKAADHLAQAVSLSGKMQPKVGLWALSRDLSKELGISESETRLILTALVNFFRTQVRLKKSASQTAEIVAYNLGRTAKTDDEKVVTARWNAAIAKIVEAAGQLNHDHTLLLSAKAFRVATARQYELIDMRIFTDARPVFNEAGDVITQTVITHVLSLDYHDCHDHRVLQLTLDAEDVITLKNICERATKKAVILQSALKPMGWPTAIFREPLQNQES